MSDVMFVWKSPSGGKQGGNYASISVSIRLLLIVVFKTFERTNNLVFYGDELLRQQEFHCFRVLFDR